MNERLPHETVNRRRLLQAAGATAGGLLSGCLGRQRYQPNRAATDRRTTINQVYPGFFEEYVIDDSGTTASEALRQKFVDATSFDFEVAKQATTNRAADAHSFYVSQFNAQSSRFDVGSMDVIWPAEFIQNDWVAPTEDRQNVFDNMIEPAVDAVSVDGQAYGMPLYIDANLLYYRSDLIDEEFETPPRTYGEVIQQSKQLLPQLGDDWNGFVWQGGPTEGLTVNWLNWLWGMDGSIFDSDGNIEVNSQKGVRALQHAHDLIYEHEITPESVTQNTVDSARRTFQEGKTLFMRNWLVAYPTLTNEETSNVAGSFDITAMPVDRNHPNASNSCLGGWSFFVNAESYNRDEAMEFISYAGTMDVQAFLAQKLSLAPIRKEIYQMVPDSNPIGRLSKILDRVRRRPLIPQYQLLSEIIAAECNRALRQQKSPEQALDDAQARIEEEGIQRI